MKLYVSKGAKVSVAPFAGAWIEMMTNSTYTGEYDVAPFAGAWIEIVRAAWLPCGRLRSLPSRERGLKFYRDGCGLFKGKVAPFAGAWIEI